MISFLNLKYGAGSKIFLKVLEKTEKDPKAILTAPMKIVKLLIKETLEKIEREAK